MNKYNLVDCNQLSKELIYRDLWVQVKPLLEKNVVCLDDVKSIKVVSAVKKKAKVVILDNNPLSVSCYMDEHPETFKKKKGVETKNGK